MKILPLRAVAAVFGLLFCSGCFVKEDRSGCPCRLLIDFSEIDGSVADAANLVITAADDFAFSETLDLGSLEDEKCVLIPRGRAVVGVWAGVESPVEVGGFEIPFGSDCPSVYFYASIIDADCEVYRESVCLRKNHCVMTVNLKNMDPSPSRIGFMGKVSGYGPDGRPLEGDFSYFLDSPSLSGNKVILPRQLDDSLKMEVIDAFGVSRIFALGGYIADSGYDWGAQDLEDIEVDLDIAMTRVTLTIQGWDKTYSYEVVM